MRINTLPPLFFALFTLSGCTSDPLDVDVKNYEVKLEFKRLDQNLFQLNPSAGETKTDEIYVEYGQFLVDYCEGVVQIGNPEDEGFPFSVSRFITDENMKVLYDDTQTEYEDVSTLESELNQAFTYFHYHFPDSTIPEVVFMISALNYPIVATHNTLGISLDLFLGADYPVYPQVGLPEYMYRNMKPEQVVPQAMKGWIQSMYETEAERNSLLDYMIFEGKILYTLDAVLRLHPDSSRIGFTQDAMDWCSTYEARVWAHLIDEELLYTTKYMSINKWINQAPFVAGIPKDSPGRLGQWVGWQIVRKYMTENPDISIGELMLNNDSQAILSRSKYKPKL
jgi:hypothetical protein